MGHDDDGSVERTRSGPGVLRARDLVGYGWGHPAEDGGGPNLGAQVTNVGTNEWRW